MLTELTSALAAVKTISEISKLLVTTKSSDAAVSARLSELNAVIISLQHALMRIQLEYQLLLRDKDQLEKRLLEIEDWNAQASRYELKEIAPGVFVYAFNPTKRERGPSPWFCAQCYEKKQRSILQRTKREIEGTTYSCPNCRTEFLDHVDAAPLI